MAKKTLATWNHMWIYLQLYMQIIYMHAYYIIYAKIKYQKVQLKTIFLLKYVEGY